jgi:amino acid transporter
VVLGIWSVQISRISPSLGAGQGGSILDAAAVFFLSYMGFGLITNASENLRDPERNVPRAIFISIFIVTVVYLLVTVVAMGNLSLQSLIQAQDYALAEAAKPFLGQAGYLLVTLGALFSISSALNATLYGGANIAFSLAKEGELPEIFERKSWFGAPEGLYLTAGLGLIFALSFGLNGIASITSAIFMVVYLFVMVSHLRLRNEVGGSRFIIVLGLVIVGTVFFLLMRYQWRTDRTAFWATWGTLAGSLMVETVYRLLTHRILKSRSTGDGSSGGHMRP